MCCRKILCDKMLQFESLYIYVLQSVFYKMPHFEVWSTNRLTKKILVADDFQSFIEKS